MANITRVDPLDDLFRGFFVRPVDFNGTNQQPPAIKMDVKEQGENYVVHAELPGVKKENIHVVVDGNQVSISAEVSQENEGRKVSAPFVRSGILAKYRAHSNSDRKLMTAMPLPALTMAFLN